jgi:hypothetical protein
MPTARRSPPVKATSVVAGAVPGVAAALDSWLETSRRMMFWSQRSTPSLRTRALRERFGVALERSANCVILAARWEGRLICRMRRVRHDESRRERSGEASSRGRQELIRCDGCGSENRELEYGGITPLGLRAGWPILIDETTRIRLEETRDSCRPPARFSYVLRAQPRRDRVRLRAKAGERGYQERVAVVPTLEAFGALARSAPQTLLARDRSEHE